MANIGLQIEGEVERITLDNLLDDALDEGASSFFLTAEDFYLFGQSIIDISDENSLSLHILEIGDGAVSDIIEEFPHLSITEVDASGGVESILESYCDTVVITD